MDRTSRVAGHPSFAQRTLIHREIAEDHLDSQGVVHLLVELAQDTYAVPQPMPLRGLRNVLASRDGERHNAVHRAVVDVVVCLARELTKVHRQNRLRLLASLNLRLSAD